MVAAANRFLSKLFLLSKSNLGRKLLHSGTIRRTHATMANAATATWLAIGFNSRKNDIGITSFPSAGIVRKSDANRKCTPALQVVWPIRTILAAIWGLLA